MEETGEEKLYFPLFKSVKHHEAPSWQSVSTDFVSDCSMIQGFQLRTFLEYPKDSYLHHPLE